MPVFLDHGALPEVCVARPLDLFRHPGGVLRVLEGAVRILGLYIAVHKLDKQFLFKLFPGFKLVLGGFYCVFSYVFGYLGIGLASNHDISL